MKVLKEYKGSHHYFEEVEKCDLFCPSCGDKALYKETGSGDYYLGVTYYCTSCYKNHNLDYSDQNSDNVIVELINQIKNNKCNEPTTRKGH